MGEARREPIKIVAENRKARHDYFIDETYEAGISLVGTEVKSLRAGKVNLRDCYADVINNELFVHNMHISPYDKGNRFNHDPKRTRKLLMHRQEIKRLLGQTTQKGYTMIPLRVYFKRGRAKIEVALARGKKLYDKREELAKKDAEREVARELRGREKE